MSWCLNKCVHLSIYGLLREWMKNFHEGAHWELAENLTLTKCYSDQSDLFTANYFILRSLKQSFIFGQGRIKTQYLENVSK